MKSKDIKVGDIIYTKEDMFTRFYYISEINDSGLETISWAYADNTSTFYYYGDMITFQKELFDNSREAGYKYKFIQDYYTVSFTDEIIRHEKQQRIKCTFVYRLEKS
jgi:hypothetical protein